MSDIIDFATAVAETAGEPRALLLGNGFSARHFQYATLLEASKLELGTPLRKLFSALDTVDFEKVVRALEEAIIVESAYGHDERAAELREHAQDVRTALVQAIVTTHPTRREELASQYDHCATFLHNFEAVFSLNYDLLLYLGNLERRVLPDGFGFGKKQGLLFGPFNEKAHCALYNLHGGLHLFEDQASNMHKAVKDGRNGKSVINAVTDIINEEHSMPVCVAEGSSTQKMQKINSVAYLRYCYEKLSSNARTLFVFGHSADENDEHIYKAVFNSKISKIYFGIYRPDTETINKFTAQFAKYRALWKSPVAYYFYDSESADVWGH